MLKFLTRVWNVKMDGCDGDEVDDKAALTLVALIIVPGGFGPLFAPHLGASTRLIARGECGEAAVDYLVCQDASVLEWLRRTPEACPVIGVMALLAVVPTLDLDALRDAIHHSNHWPVLRPSVCHGLMLLAGVTPLDLLCDPMCGVGSLPVEAVRRFGSSYVLGGDHSRTAVREAGKTRHKMRQRRRGKGAELEVGLDYATGADGGDGGVRLRVRPRAAKPSVDLMRWDATCLPLRSGRLDKVVVDVPWGNRGKAEPALLRDTLNEIERVLTDEGLAIILLIRATARALERATGCRQLTVVDSLDVFVGGWPVTALSLRKVSAAATGRAAAGESCAVALEDEAMPMPTPPPPKPRVVASACCCTVEVDGEHLGAMNLAELLLVAFCNHGILSLSSARRAVRRRRVCLLSAPNGHDRLSCRASIRQGERIVLRPHVARLQPSDVLLAMHDREPLRVIWEDDRWLVVVKPAGMGVLKGRRSLANMLLALQLSRGAAEGRPPHEEAPWTAAYDGPARVGGCWLCAKSAQPAVDLLDGRVTATLEWRAIIRGGVDEGARSTMAKAGLANVAVLRVGRSVRYESITEVRFEGGCSNMEQWRNALAANGHPVVGDRPHCDGPSACFWVTAVKVAEAAEAKATSHESSSSSAPPPERFGRLFEREEVVASSADCGELISAYAERMLTERLGEGGGADDEPVEADDEEEDDDDEEVEDEDE